jgi:hypothetical protein
MTYSMSDNVKMGLLIGGIVGTAILLALLLTYGHLFAAR